MADIQLTHDQQQQLENLTAAIGQDAAVRRRLQEDPRTVLGEYGLSELLPADGEFSVIVSEPEVAGFVAAKPHIDYVVHRDSTTHLDTIIHLPLQSGPLA